MHNKSFARIAHAVTPFILLAVLFLGGIYYVLLSTMARVVADDAELTAGHLSSYLAARPDALSRLAAGGDLTPSAAAFFTSFARSQNVMGFRLFDAAGSPVSKVTTPAESQAPKEDRQLHKSSSQIRSPDGQALSLVVLTDERAREAMVASEFWKSFLALTFLTICSFGVPAFVFLRELAQRERGEERMEYLAQHDLMTALMNRTAFNVALECALVSAEGLTALHFIDLDRFKSVNDSLGHDVGDELIKSVADRLLSIAGPHDFVARFGGDEFVMAQTRLTSIQDAQFRAARIKDILSTPVTVGEHRVRASASVGVAVAPRDGTNFTALTRAADLAVYKAKADGRDAWRMYDPAMDVALQQRQRVERALLDAVAEEGFDLYYQPIVRTDDKTLLGFEVLLRLETSDGEQLQPTEFIPIAEEMGLISEVGAFVLRKACASAVLWPDDLTVAVNLSPQQFQSGQLVGVVADALAGSGLAPNRLELEITEGLLLSDSERVVAQLHELKSLGVSIAMDDFGTGYSSLSYLWRFPFDKLKIDRSFMPVLSDNHDNVASILKTIVALGRTLNLRVTAEGVETEEQARVLKSLKCDQLQGYHFGRPMPEADVAATILEHCRLALERPEISKHDAA